MVKDYLLSLLNWTKATISLYGKRSEPTFKEGEIWWCSIGMNIGIEIFGKGKSFSRPVVVFKKIAKNSFLGLPLTTQLKEGSWYVPVSYGGITCRAILSQARVFDRKRLIKIMGTLSRKNFENIKKQFAAFYVS
jgi:mRNA interferase MazF